MKVANITAQGECSGVKCITLSLLGVLLCADTCKEVRTQFMST